MSERSDLAKRRWSVKRHAACHLNTWFKDYGSYFSRVLFDQITKVSEIFIAPFGIFCCRRSRGKEMLRESLGKEVVHACLRITDRHGSASVTMVAAPYC